MNPHSLIEGYVADVVRRLPRKQRGDVAYELRALLAEELQGRAEASAVQPDAELTLALLADFGRPADVADRYRPAGFAIIRPSDAPRFAQVALIGVGLQWIVTLIGAFSAPGDVSWLSRLGSWWVTWGLGSFWWPGLLVTLSIIAALITARAGRRTVGEPRVADLDPDHVRKPVTALYLGLGVIGATVVIALPTIGVWGGVGCHNPLLDVFAFDSDFLAWRAPWVLPLWVAELVLAVTIIASGRRTASTRRIDVALGVAWLVLLGVWVLAGPIFVAPATEVATKSILTALLVLSAVMIIVQARRLWRAEPAPAEGAGFSESGVSAR